jgi:hypothetical protein
MFPDATAALLMPDHLHLATLLCGTTVELLGRVLQHHARRFGAAWDIGPPTPSHTRQILGRTVRYIYLNPVRAKIVDDPLAWPWSTLRDAVGATAHPWGGPDAIAGALKLSGRRLHALTTSDLSCDRRARTAVAVLRPSEGLAINLAAVADACASALRCHPGELHRRRSRIRPVFVHVACNFAAPRVIDLAQACRVSPRTIADLRARATPEEIRAASRCLGDPRLRIWNATRS